MIAKMIGNALVAKVKKDISGRARATSLADKALVEFFGLDNRPGITDRDLIKGSEAMQQKCLAHMEWQERRQMYEEFTGRRWK